MILDPVYVLSDDQLANQFRITFPKGIPGGVDSNVVSLRMDQSFQPPEITANMYEYYVRGHKFSKPGMLDESTKELTFMVRMDQQWKVWDELYAWKKLCYDDITGTRASSIDCATTMLVEMLDGNDNVTKTFRYGYVYCKGVALETLDNQSGDPLRITLNMVYNTLDIE